MILEKKFAKRLLNTAGHRTLALCTLVLLTLSTGCASSGSLQPHQAFRQATPYQGYYAGQQAAFPAANPATSSNAAGNFAGYGGYNNSLPGIGQANPATGSYGGSGSASRNINTFQPQFNSPGGFGSASRNVTGFQPQYQGGFQGGYQQFQPSFGGGFTSGSC